MEKLSKFLSYVLRHAPQEIGIELDSGGWTNIDTLIKKAKAAGTTFDRAKLDELVADNDKKRFTISENGKLIRAAQGHSIKVDLGLEPIVPPEVLYHGTASRFLDSIFEKGIIAGSRDKVHLSADYDTAVSVGSRHGKPIVLALDVAALVACGQHFWRADNGVYLTDVVPPEFLKIADDQSSTVGGAP